jgi:hypothetical protein
VSPEWWAGVAGAIRAGRVAGAIMRLERCPAPRGSADAERASALRLILSEALRLQDWSKIHEVESVLA